MSSAWVGLIAEPAMVVHWFKDRRHPVMDIGDERVP